jgi:hypothetical protein
MTQRGCGVLAAKMKVFAMLLMMPKAYPIRGVYFNVRAVSAVQTFG